MTATRPFATSRSSRSGRSGRTPLRSCGPGCPRSRDARNQAALAEALGLMNDAESVQVLTALIIDGSRPETVRAAALDGLARFRGPDILRARLGVLYDPKSPDALIARALPPLARDGIIPPNDVAGFLDHASPTVRSAALMSLNVKKALPSGDQDAGPGPLRRPLARGSRGRPDGLRRSSRSARPCRGCSRSRHGQERRARGRRP